MCAICVAISLIKERKKYNKINLLIYVIGGKKGQTKQTKTENKTSSCHLIGFYAKQLFVIMMKVHFSCWLAINRIPFFLFKFDIFAFFLPFFEGFKKKCLFFFVCFQERDVL